MTILRHAPTRYARRRRRARCAALAAAGAGHALGCALVAAAAVHFVPASVRSPVGAVSLRINLAPPPAEPARAAPPRRPVPEGSVTPEWRVSVRPDAAASRDSPTPRPAPDPASALPLPAVADDADSLPHAPLPAEPARRDAGLTRGMATTAERRQVGRAPPCLGGAVAATAAPAGRAATPVETAATTPPAPARAAAPANRRPTGVRRAAEAVDYVPPDYPADSRRRREEGTVVVAIAFDASGRVRATRVHRSSGYDRLDQAALRAVRRTRFNPPRRDGAPVAVEQTMQYEFRLR